MSSGKEYTQEAKADTNTPPPRELKKPRVNSSSMSPAEKKALEAAANQVAQDAIKDELNGTHPDSRRLPSSDKMTGKSDQWLRKFKFGSGIGDPKHRETVDVLKENAAKSGHAEAVNTRQRNLKDSSAQR